MSKVALLITTFNRPDYLTKCLESLNKSDLSKIDSVLVFDDASTDPTVSSTVLHFFGEKNNWTFVREEKNKGIKNSLLHGYEILFKNHDLVINLDADALVSVDGFNRIISLKQEWPALIVSGFHCNTLNRDGSVRHQVLYESSNASFRRTVGGINLCINKEQYYKYVKPALEEPIGNWDQKACLNASAHSLPIAVTKPSCIQHIGINSSLGHDAGGEPADVADDFDTDTWYSQQLLDLYRTFEDGRIDAVTEKIEVPEYLKDILTKLRQRSTPIEWGKIDEQELGLLKKFIYKIDLSMVTLVGVDCVDIDRLLRVADKACEEIQFGAVKMLSSIPSNDPRVIKIREIKSKEDYSVFMMKELANYIETSHLLIIQHDGWVINPSAWDSGWLKFDYIGARWHFGDQNHPVGNGGMSLRTKRLHEILRDDNSIITMNEPGVSFHMEEDHCIARIYGKYLQQHYQIKFAPVEVAEKFSIEGWGNPDPVYRGQFGYHGDRVIFK